MRGAAKVAVRGVVAFSMVMVMATPTQAGPRDGSRWFERRVDPIVKIVKRMLGIRSQGDGLSDPRP